MSENEKLLQGQLESSSCKKKIGKDKRKPTESAFPTRGGELVVEKKKPLQSSVKQMSQVAATSNVNRKAAGSNWEAVAKSYQQVKGQTDKQENVPVDKDEVTLTKSARMRQKKRAAEKNYVALDCEMVGWGPNGQDDMVARVSIVDKRGNVLMDKFVKPQNTVTDYRTAVSGIRPQDIANGENFTSVQDEVVQILEDKMLIGHSIRKDLAVLDIRHPKSRIRDTSCFKPLRQLVSNGHTPSLKRLAQAVLGKEIQTGEHNSVEDARAVMSIYNRLASDWEAYIKRHQRKVCK